MERALNETLRSAQEYRNQLETVLTRSNDAIAQVQEGILVEANRSWLDLIGAVGRRRRGRPAGHGFLRRGQSCRTQGRAGRLPAGPLEGSLAARRRADHRWRHAVAGTGADAGRARWRTLRAPHGADAEARRAALERDLSDAIRRNPRTGLLYRQPLLEDIQKRTGDPGAGRQPLSVCSCDRTSSPNSNAEWASCAARTSWQRSPALVRAHMAPSDIAGISAARACCCCWSAARRATSKPGRASARKDRALRVRALAAARPQLRCCIGLAAVPNARPQARRNAIARRAGRSAPRPRNAAATRSAAHGCAPTPTRACSRTTPSGSSTSGRAGRRIASGWCSSPSRACGGGGVDMFDMLVRMLDTPGQGNPAVRVHAGRRAQRTCCATIDRWVINGRGPLCPAQQARMPVRAAVAAIARWTPRCRAWLVGADRAACRSIRAAVHPGHRRPRHAPSRRRRRTLAQGLARRGHAIRAGAFRHRHRSAGRCCNSLPLDFIKIDGSLMQGLTDDAALQTKVSALIEAARGMSIETIAERVEDANTMAVLWQLGRAAPAGLPDPGAGGSGDVVAGQHPPSRSRRSRCSTLPRGRPCGSCATASRRAARARRDTAPAPSSSASCCARRTRPRVSAPARAPPPRPAALRAPSAFFVGMPKILLPLPRGISGNFRRREHQQPPFAVHRAR